MRRTKRVSSRARLLLKVRPTRGALVRYGDRIDAALREARGERVMIRSLQADGRRSFGLPPRVTGSVIEALTGSLPSPLC